MYGLESIKTKWHELRILREDLFDAYIFYSKSDRDEVERMFPSLGNKLYFITVGVDFEAFHRSMIIEIPGVDQHNKVILFVGSMDHPGNEDAARWFAAHIFPQIARKVPSAKFLIVGRHAARKVGDLSSKDIIVVGDVPDTVPYLNRADLCVVPLRGGAGVRVKLLEALAARKIVISTRIGIEALDLHNNEHLLIAEDEEDFAQKAVDVLSRVEMYDRLAQAGYEAVKQKYSSERIGEEVESLYLQLGKAAAKSPIYI